MKFWICEQKSTGQLSQLLLTSKIASIYLSTKLQYSFLAFIASILMVTDKDSLSEVAQYVPRSVFECLHCFQRNLISYLYFARVDHFLIITSGFYTKFLSLLKVICVDSYMVFLRRCSSQCKPSTNLRLPVGLVQRGTSGIRF